MKAIIEREFLDNLKSMRFIALLILSIILFSANGFIFSKRYNKLEKYYQNRTSEPPFRPSIQATFYGSNVIFDTNGGPNYPRPSTVATEMYPQPSPFLFVAEGGDKYRPYGYDLRPGGIIYPLPAKPQNYKIPEFPDIDWSFIITIIFSIYAILFSYNAISGEKEDGTLSLVLSNPISRIRLLLTKYIVILFTLLIPLIIGFIISLIITLFFVPHFFTVGTISKLFFIAASSCIYISLFILLALSLSSLIYKSSLGLLVLFSVWIFFFTIPHIAGIIAEKSSNIPSEIEISQQFIKTREEYEQKFENMFINQSSPDFIGGFSSREEATETVKPYSYEAHRSFLKIEKLYGNALMNSMKRKRSLSLISPISLLRHIMENFSGTGILSEEHFLNDVERYSQVYDDYILEKIGEVVIMSREIFIGSWVRYSSGSTGSIQFELYPKEYEGDKSDFPRFVESKASLGQFFYDSAVDIAGLLFWNIVLAIGAFWAFLRADVR
ncbi:MAG: ABC transporter permease subunit [Candidatus Latescibacteria bacterium]|jgi:ABC-type transport system involved in multi-copper enzyme maturation permease subunit|nr:ABC transporter permease subunit [Candidatus Latescibacterota bacterium]